MAPLALVTLTAAAFAPYGTILSEEQPNADVDSSELRYVGGVFTADIGPVSVGLMTCKARPAVLHRMERHVRTPEILANLGGPATIAVAAPGLPFPESRGDGVTAFRLASGTAIALRPGTWHWAPFPEGSEAVYLVAFAQGTEATDLEVAELPSPIAISG